MNEERKFLFWIAVFLVTFFSVMTSCHNKEMARKAELREDDPLKYAIETQCHSKRSGSTPACWSEGDWEAICSRIKCK